ncbi:MAG: cytochrome c biogenesis protein [Planctomycetota bacterium]
MMHALEASPARPRWQSILAVAAALCLSLLASCGRAAPELGIEPDRIEPWSEEVVDELARVPIQDNGRIKPLSVLAAVTLYKVHGRRDLKFQITKGGDVEKTTLNPTEWLLDVWCYPRQAANYPLFRVEHSGVLDALEVENDGQKQGFEFLSYSQVYRKVDKLEELAQSYGKLEREKRSEVQEHIWQLWLRFLRYNTLQQQLGALASPTPVADPGLQEKLGGERVTLANLVANAGALQAAIQKVQPDGTGGPDGLLDIANYMRRALDNDRGGAKLFAPVGTSLEGADDLDKITWRTLGEASEQVIRGQRGDVQDAIVALGSAVTAPSHPDTERSLLEFSGAASRAAAPFCAPDNIDREAYYYVAGWAYQSIHWFLLGLILAVFTWLFRGSKLLLWASFGVTVLALGMLGYDLVLRCLITGRPPIKNLYDTFLFIAFVGVFVLMLTELVLPRRIALAGAPFLGALLVHFARMYELSDGSDTMDPLVAVLDSNFWLATHVTTINIGYAAGMVGALLGMAWVVMRASTLFHPSDHQMKAVVRSAYGVTCFGLTFAVVGTILGGVWANDSWGRFWGWDPKENGALLICLAQISLLHARFSGLVRDMGFMLWAIATGIVVVFSWFHVNLFQTGLHSYGFSAGLLNAVWISYSALFSFIVVGAIDGLLRPNPVRRVAADASSKAAEAAAAGSS